MKSEFDSKQEKFIEELKLKGQKISELIEEKDNLIKFTKELNSNINNNGFKSDKTSQMFDNKENKNQLNVNTSSFFKDENSLKLKVSKRKNEIQKNEISLNFEENLENLELTSTQKTI